MEIFSRLKNYIQNLENRQVYYYSAGALGIIALLMGLFIYIHMRKVNRYKEEIKNIDIQRKKTKNILTQHKIAMQQQAQVEEILAKNPEFRIAQAYRDIVQKLNLLGYQPDEPERKEGESIENKTERLLTARLNNISMKQATQLLEQLANVRQIYPKNITIKKSAQTPTVDIELTIATLEPTSALE